MTNSSGSRRGRLPAAERAAREHAILDAAEQVLIDDGIEAMSMLAVARRAGASKQTLYAWFGDRDGLIRAIIRRNADASAETIAAALATDAPATDVLTGYATGLLTLLTRPQSIALNRAAMTSPGLAAELLRSGRHRVGPIVERYLAQLHDDGVLHVPDPVDAFTLLYGLVVRDTQIRVLLGDDPPTTDEIHERVAAAVSAFVARCSLDAT
ncbi:MAG: TetR/AcrR family transcriptional regulator [Actinomycetota bacterium]